MLHKSSNEQPTCMDESECTAKVMEESISYCKEFTKGRGPDLGQTVFYHILTQEDQDQSPDGWKPWLINLHGTPKVWAIILAIAAMNEGQPV